MLSSASKIGTWATGLENGTYAWHIQLYSYEDAKRIVRIVVVLSVIWGVVGTYVCYIYSHPSADFQQWGEQVFQLNNWETGSKIPVVVGSHIVSEARSISLRRI